MSELEQLQKIKVDVLQIGQNVNLLGDSFSDLVATTNNSFPDKVVRGLANISLGLEDIFSWTQQAIQAIEQGETPEVPLSVIEQFLKELKLVFEKYSASIEVKEWSAYGESYGGADVLEFTATLDGVTEWKVVTLNNSILTAEGL